MPVIKRKLATAPAPRLRVAAPISITRRQSAIQIAPSQSTDQRGMNVKAAAKYLGTSVWQVRKFFREGILKPFPIGNKDMVDRSDLDALIESLKSAA